MSNQTEKNFLEIVSRVLSLLSLNADMQIAYLNNFGIPVDELALEFDDMFLLAKLHKHLFTQHKNDILMQIDETLVQMSATNNARLWTQKGLSESEEWERIRALSKKYLENYFS